MRLLAPSLALVLVALGGVALAQPAGVVDPWKRPANEGAWFTAGKGDSAAALPVEAVLHDPFASVPKSEPTVASTKRAEAPAAPVRSIAAFDVEEPIVVDPWALSRASSSTTEETSPARAGAWSGRVVEIVDPWKRVPEATPTDEVRLVVDPWAP